MKESGLVLSTAPRFLIIVGLFCGLACTSAATGEKRGLHVLFVGNRG